MASEKLLYRPPAAWVQSVEVPISAKPSRAAVDVLLLSTQERLAPGDDEIFQETVTRINSPQGLQAAANLTETWNPVIETRVGAAFELAVRSAPKPGYSSGRALRPKAATPGRSAVGAMLALSEGAWVDAMETRRPSQLSTANSGRAPSPSPVQLFPDDQTSGSVQLSNRSRLETRMPRRRTKAAQGDVETIRHRESIFHQYGASIGGGLAVLAVAGAITWTYKHYFPASATPGNTASVDHQESSRVSTPDGKTPPSVHYALPVRASNNSKPSLRAQAAIEDAIEARLESATGPLSGNPRIDLYATTNVPPDNLTVHLVVSYASATGVVRCPFDRAGDIRDTANLVASQVAGQPTVNEGEPLKCPL